MANALRELWYAIPQTLGSLLRKPAGSGRRLDSLTIHIDHGCWQPTPYISFTISPQNLEELAGLRANRRGRGPHSLTAVDPNYRIRKGLPVLDVAEEMAYYGIDDPYGRSSKYYKDHYVCLWEVTEAEIVGHWHWEELVENENWYEDVIMPAFTSWVHDGQADNSDDLSCLFNGLSLTTGHPDPTNSNPPGCSEAGEDVEFGRYEHDSDEDGDDSEAGEDVESSGYEHDDVEDNDSS
ncbi:hypothetical protein DV735_g4000, partial [Chaetothyriales sp. CBS 134920]